MQRNSLWRPCSRTRAASDRRTATALVGASEQLHSQSYIRHRWRLEAVVQAHEMRRVIDRECEVGAHRDTERTRSPLQPRERPLR